MTPCQEELTRNQMQRNTAQALLTLSVTFVVTLTAFLFLARWHWAPELFTHFRLPYLFVFTFVLLITLLVSQWKRSIAVGICLIIQILSVAPHYFPHFKDHREGQGTVLKVISFNVLSSNTEYERVLSFLEKEEADVILLQEINPAWMNSLKALRDKYPHRIEYPRQDNFGLLLLSKLPLASHEVVRIPETNTPFIIANLDWNGENLRFFGAHPYTPLSAQGARSRNISLQIIKERSQTTSGLQIIAGDLNCSAFSPHFTSLKKGLRDSAAGRGYSATWQRKHPILGIPIDHILTSEELVCNDFQIGQKNGSDHSPLIGIYQRAR